MKKKKWFLSVSLSDGKVANTNEDGFGPVDAFLRMVARNSGDPSFSRWANASLINAWELTQKQYEKVR